MSKRTKGRVEAFNAQTENGTENRTREPRKPVDWKKKKRVRINRGKMALTVIVVLMIAVLGMSVKNIFDLRAEQKALKDQNESLAVEKESLKDELKNVNDKEYIEEQARIQLKLIKPGEILYILEDYKKESDSEDEEDN